MKAEINIDGQLVVISETSTDAYALNKWYGEFVKEVYKEKEIPCDIIPKVIVKLNKLKNYNPTTK